MWEKLNIFIREVRGEFARVTWPTREDLVNSTTGVLVFSAIFAILDFSTRCWFVVAEL